jgi:addiction module RelE/StbE family toxin
LKLIWSRRAKTDLREIREGIRKGLHNPSAAKNVSTAIIKTARQLKRFPFMGHPGDDGTREMLVTDYPSYLLIYDVDETAKTVTVVTIWKQWFAR